MMDRCWICLDEETEDLVSPCQCRGSIKWVHQQCVIGWMRESQKLTCSLCQSPLASWTVDYRQWVVSEIVKILVLLVYMLCFQWQVCWFWWNDLEILTTSIGNLVTLIAIPWARRWDVRRSRRLYYMEILHLTIMSVVLIYSHPIREFRSDCYWFNILLYFVNGVNLTLGVEYLYLLFIVVSSRLDKVLPPCYHLVFNCFECYKDCSNKK
eukprot:GILJ01026927.1.p1 GENE.GILJ01026927.1~~GILJ01026927.1.p1  ORF type:complete len:210 (-),score=4.65 GILJ01026927.1:26-655(-)